jgi:oligopeptide/dipeptide ABC transporter ATP-binding protein
MISSTAPLLSVRNLTVHFSVPGGFLSKPRPPVRAVDGVSFDIAGGETLGLVGESGCGKSTTARAVLRVIEPTGGSVFFQGEDLLALNPRKLKERRRDMQMVFQDPYASLDARRTVANIIGEPLVIHGIGARKDRTERVLELMDLVGLRREHLFRFPHQFSGGQRQRIGIARALALNPSLVVCDEPVSALDVSIQAQILNLLEDLQEKLGMAYLFIAHDLAVVQHMANRVAVMYLGKIVELAKREELFSKPLHPYTIGLMGAVPVPDPVLKREKKILLGDIPSPSAPPPGCAFNTRCPEAQQLCREIEPELREVECGHFCRCHFR